MGVSTDSGFGRRLRAERERRKITLQSIAENTKISLSLLEGLEKDDVSRWPAGIFRRAFIRAYAQSVGLDPDDTAREFLERFPDPADAVDPVSSVATLSRTTVRTTLPDPTAPRPAAPPTTGLRPDAPRTDAPATAYQRLSVRVRIANAGTAFMRGPLVPEVPRRWAAAIWDAGVLVAIGTLMFIALREFWMPFALVTLGYYAGSIVLLGNTPGVSLFAEEKRREL